MAEPPLPPPKLVYRCRVFSVHEGDVRLPDGRITRQSWIDHRPCIAVVPVNAAGELVLIRQYRQATGGMILEIPAGTMDRDNESVEACAQRELSEEIGFGAGELVKLFEGYLIPGYGNEYMHFFLARDLYPASLPADPDEFIRVTTVPLDEARAMLRDRRIVDVKTALGIHLAGEFLQAERSAER
jgi:ADP-ribose pyrophosphatase